MLTTKVTGKTIKEWKRLFEKYRYALKPNLKNKTQIYNFICSKYNIKVWDNSQSIEAFSIVKDEKSKFLYKNQDKAFKDCKEIIFFFSDDIAVNFCNVEGSGYLWDECLAFRGLDDNDLKNYALVGQYILALQKFDMLENVLLGRDNNSF